MKTVLEILTLSTDYLKHKKIENPRRQAEEIISDALDIQRLQLYMEFDRPLTDEELDLCRKRLARRGKGEPAQYIRGEVQFYHCTLKVTPDVLIPRQETEILVDKVVKYLEKVPREGKILWDICSGSGCIGIALKKRFPELEVTLSDISSKALDIAKENARLNQVDIDFQQGDFFEPFNGKRADFIICNPPYVTQEEYHNLQTEVKDYEPLIALVGGEKGIEFYERLAQEAPNFLQPGGKVWLEIGDKQKEAINALFASPDWKTCRCELDWSNRDRFFFLEIE